MLRGAQIAFTNIDIIRNELSYLGIAFIGGIMKRTKIVCTVGPGTDKFGILEDMISLTDPMKSRQNACKWCAMRR